MASTVRPLPLLFFSASTAWAKVRFSRMPCSMPGAAVAVRGLVAQHAAQPHRLEAFLQGGERAFDEGRGSVMVDHRRAACLDRFQGADQAAGLQHLLVDRPVQTPPEVGQRGDEIRAGSDPGHDSARQPRVEVVMAADETRHEHPAVEVDGPLGAARPPRRPCPPRLSRSRREERRRRRPRPPGSGAQRWRSSARSFFSPHEIPLTQTGTDGFSPRSA